MLVSGISVYQVISEDCVLYLVATETKSEIYLLPPSDAIRKQKNLF